MEKTVLFGHLRSTRCLGMLNADKKVLILLPQCYVSHAVNAHSRDRGSGLQTYSQQVALMVDARSISP